MSPSSLIFDFADIRSRMLGDLKARPEPSKPLCPKCDDAGWVNQFHPTVQPYFVTCNFCYNPRGLPSP